MDEPFGCKVYVSNLPFEAKWQQVKDLFTEQVSKLWHGLIDFVIINNWNYFYILNDFKTVKGS
jgi:RNA recognition motif-containing protein